MVLNMKFWLHVLLIVVAFAILTGEPEKLFFFLPYH